MLWSVRMAERHGHHLVEYHHGISGCFIQAQPDQTVDSLHMTFVTDIMTVNTSRFAFFFFVT